ncbi:hypothetical protein LCM20_01655 [Halobacillus litoralis]|uniref:hypothetical protein n=1 Tax=Halobacillus litoralis TaxID=45668 RepID=UPI001CD74FDB|nr:hypothetical protein [Halobacillus litoralis]MCA0969292.1 hypothetical protein [Halobacillus litoralis]
MGLLYLVIIVSLIIGVYSTIKQFKVKEMEVQLEWEKVELEKRKLHMETVK